MMMAVSQVKMLQDLFTRVSQDGIMGPPEWRRCLTAAGVHNTFVVERLFEIFDSTGDRRMTAKEFTSGLSAIANDMDYRYVFKYQLESLCKKGDILLIIFSIFFAPLRSACRDLASKRGSGP